jgi:hypothetical protein
MACTRWWILGLLAVGACRTVRPEDVPTATTAAASQAAAFPGAPSLLSGFDLGGERGLRHGDRLLYGVTLQDGERVSRRLLRLEVDRDDPELDTHLLLVQQKEPQRRLASRPTRPMGLLLLLTDADGKELQRSRIDTFDAHLESSFTAGVLAQQRNDPLPVAVATLQLLEICNLLGSDAILKRLLGEVASVPLDIRLLWRRRLVLEPGFEQATPCAATAAAGGGPQPVFDLPFDLYLNDSLLVRCTAAIVAPQGPTAAAAGIVRLSAQQAEQPGPRLELELLAAARGPRSDFAAHEAAAFLGYDDEGTALAFSPDGRFVAMPGARGTVELRDLRREDPSPAIELLGSIERTAALHFLDATTLLVARGKAIEVFSCDGAMPGGTAGRYRTSWRSIGVRRLPRRGCRTLDACRRQCGAAAGERAQRNLADRPKLRGYQVVLRHHPTRRLAARWPRPGSMPRAQHGNRQRRRGRDAVDAHGERHLAGSAPSAGQRAAGAAAALGW